MQLCHLQVPLLAPFIALPGASHVYMVRQRDPFGFSFPSLPSLFFSFFSTSASRNSFLSGRLPDKTRTYVLLNMSPALFFFWPLLCACRCLTSRIAPLQVEFYQPLSPGRPFRRQARIRVDHVRCSHVLGSLLPSARLAVHDSSSPLHRLPEYFKQHNYTTLGA